VLTKIAETDTTITLGWTPPANCVGYVLYANGVRKSNSWDGGKKTWRLAKGVWPPPTTPVAEDFTGSPANPNVNEPVTFTVINPHAGFSYGWDRTGDKVPEFSGTSYVYGYQSVGTKTMNLM